VVILDEPMVGLGQDSRQILKNIIVEHARRDLACLVVEHHFTEFRDIASKVVAMEQGGRTAVGAARREGVGPGMKGIENR
jgi:ABC-type branched-subunit amino acid transport system ATPase component